MSGDGDIHEAFAQAAPPKPVLTALTMEDLLARSLPPREHVLAPWLPTQGLAMLVAVRGVGKTFVALEIAHAVASGGDFLRWTAPGPRRVLFVDGEMPAVTLRDRLKAIAAGADCEPPEPDYLSVITPDFQDRSIPDLTSIEGQAAIEEHLEGVELVIFDSLSTLCRTGPENESESWLPMQEWMLSLRRRSISVLVVHHAGKSGVPRGTSRREDVLDTVISLKRPNDYHGSDGARFEVEYIKARGVYGDDAKPFEAKLEIRDGATLWTVRDIEDRITEQVAELLSENLTRRQIAIELGCGLATVQRHTRKAQNLGLLGRNT